MVHQTDPILSTTGKKVWSIRMVEYYKAENLIKGWKRKNPAGKQGRGNTSLLKGFPGFPEPALL